MDGLARSPQRPTRTFLAQRQTVEGHSPAQQLCRQSRLQEERACWSWRSGYPMGSVHSGAF